MLPHKEKVAPVILSQQTCKGLFEKAINMSLKKLTLLAK